MSFVKNNNIFNLIEEKGFFYDIWEPSSPQIVLGRFSKEKEAIKDNVYIDNLPILRRLGGGGAVFLDKGTLIFEVGLKVIERKSVDYYFDFFNKIILSSLKNQNIIANSNNEFYDITIDNKKIAGVSICIRKNLILYGSSIIINNLLIEKIDLYLKEPNKKPIYRKDRKHKEFLIALEDFKNFNLNLLKNSLKNILLAERSI